MGAQTASVLKDLELRNACVGLAGNKLELAGNGTTDLVEVSPHESESFYSYVIVTPYLRLMFSRDILASIGSIFGARHAFLTSILKIHERESAPASAPASIGRIFGARHAEGEEIEAHKIEACGVHFKLITEHGL